jgi:hypothetical protein
MILSFVFYVVTLYSQPILKPHPTALPLTPSFCIHSPNTKLNEKHSHSFRQFVFTSQYQTSLHSTPTHSVTCIHNPITNLTAQLSHSLRQFVFTTQTQTSPHSYYTHSVSLYLKPNLKPHPTAVPIPTSVCIHSPISKLTPQLSQSLLQFVFTSQS